MESFGRFCEVLTVLVIIVARNYVQGVNDDYNPLDPKVYEGYRKTSGWNLYLTDGPLSASTADFVKGFGKNAACVRTVVFMAHGAVLDHVTSDCDTPENFMGLITHDSALRYFKAALVRKEAAGNFVLVKKTNEKDKCSRTVYTIDECTGKCPSPKVKNMQESPDKSCNDLNDFTYPPMLLVSSSGDVGRFEPIGTDWMTFNPWEPLGFVTKEYTSSSSDKCFRLVVVTSYGRAVHGVKLSCGAVYGITSTDRSLRLGDTVYVTMESEDKFTVLMNPRNNNCIKKTITVEVKDGSVLRKSVNTNNRLTLQDNDCNSLVKGDVKERTVKESVIDGLKSSSLKNVFKQEILKPYTASGDLLDFSIATDIGMMVQTYTKEDNSQNNIVTLVARGVPVLPVIVDAGTPRRIIVRKDAVYYDKVLAFNKLYAEHGYQVLKRLDDGHCRRKLYDVRGNGLLEETEDKEVGKDAPETKLEGTRKETSTTKPEGNILDDHDCKNLIEGKHLKTEKALQYGDLTDEMGVPKIFPSFSDK